MATQDQILLLTNDIVRYFQPEKVILFGSYAYGTPHAGSDVDMLVIMQFDGNPIEKMIDIITTIHPKLALDLKVRTQTMIDRRIEIGDAFIRDIFNNGKVLYERDNS